MPRARPPRCGGTPRRRPCAPRYTGRGVSRRGEERVVVFWEGKNPWKTHGKTQQNQGVKPPKSWENHGKNGAKIYAPTMCQMGMFYEDMNGDINETRTV